MEYSRIVAVTGLPGLYEVLSSKADGAIVRSLDDKTTRFVSSRIYNLSHLESIEIYTVKDNVSLADIFNAMKDNKEKMPDVKDNASVKAYFEKVYPDMDFERVYTSDMKKMVKWFEVLQNNEVDFNAVSTEEESTEEEQADTEKETAAAAKKPKAKAKETVKEEEAEKKPAAKTAAATKAKTATKAKSAKTSKEADAADEKKPKTTRKKKGEE